MYIRTLTVPMLSLILLLGCSNEREEGRARLVAEVEERQAGRVETVTSGVSADTTRSFAAAGRVVASPERASRSAMKTAGRVCFMAQGYDMRSKIQAGKSPWEFLKC